MLVLSAANLTIKHYRATQWVSDDHARTSRGARSSPLALMQQHQTRILLARANGVHDEYFAIKVIQSTGEAILAGPIGCPISMLGDNRPEARGIVVLGQC